MLGYFHFFSPPSLSFPFPSLSYISSPFFFLFVILEDDVDVLMKSSSKKKRGGRKAFRWRNVNTRMTSEKNFIREGWAVLNKYNARNGNHKRESGGEWLKISIYSFIKL